MGCLFITEAKNSSSLKSSPKSKEDYAFELTISDSRKSGIHKKERQNRQIKVKYFLPIVSVRISSGYLIQITQPVICII